MIPFSTSFISDQLHQTFDEVRVNSNKEVYHDKPKNNHDREAAAAAVRHFQSLMEKDAHDIHENPHFQAYLDEQIEKENSYAYNKILSENIVSDELSQDGQAHEKYPNTPPNELTRKNQKDAYEENSSRRYTLGTAREDHQGTQKDDPSLNTQPDAKLNKNQKDTDEENSSRKYTLGTVSVDYQNTQGEDELFDSQPGAIKRKREKEKNKKKDLLEISSDNIAAAQQSAFKHQEQKVEDYSSGQKSSEQKTTQAAAGNAHKQQLAIQKSSEETKGNEDVQDLKTALQNLLDKKVSAKEEEKFASVSSKKQIQILETAKNDSVEQGEKFQSLHSQIYNQQVTASNEAQDLQKESLARVKRAVSIEQLFQDTVHQLHTPGKTGESVSLKLNEKILPETTVELKLQPNNQVLVTISTSSPDSYELMKSHFPKLCDVFSKGIAARPMKVEMQYSSTEKLGKLSSSEQENQAVKKVMWEINE